MAINSEDVRIIMEHLDCSVTEAVRYLRQRREELHRMELEATVLNATSIEDLKPAIQYLLRNLPFRRDI